MLRDDVQTIDDIEGQLAVYRSDLSREFEFRLSEVDNILHQFENRGMQFFDDTLRVGPAFPILWNKARIQREFEREVVADVPQQIERQVHDLIDWLVASELRQWQAVSDHVNRRARTHEGRLVGGEASGFQYDRQKADRHGGTRREPRRRQLRSRTRGRGDGRWRENGGRRRSAGPGRRDRTRRDRDGAGHDHRRRRDRHRRRRDDRRARHVRDSLEAEAGQSRSCARASSGCAPS